MIGDAIDIKAPFAVAFVSFLIATVYVRFALPYISPESIYHAKKKSGGGVSNAISTFLAPLRILSPRRLRLPDGKIKKHYGVIILCSGIFVGVVRKNHETPTRLRQYSAD